MELLSGDQRGVEAFQPEGSSERGGVRIVGYTGLAGTMPVHASQLYSRNVSALVAHLAAEGELRLDFDDEITAGACVTRPGVVAA